jgi:hypothetical protein
MKGRNYKKLVIKIHILCISIYLRMNTDENIHHKLETKFIFSKNIKNFILRNMHLKGQCHEIYYLLFFIKQSSHFLLSKAIA